MSIVLIFVSCAASILSCTKKVETAETMPPVPRSRENQITLPQTVDKKNSHLVIDKTSLDENKVTDVKSIKEIATIISFVASVEKESLRVLSDKLTRTQFEILSFAFDKGAGIKRTNPGFFCHQFDIRSRQKKIVEVFSICEKNPIQLAELRIASNTVSVVFKTRNWAPVIGELSAFGDTDRECEISYEKSDVIGFECGKTVYSFPPEYIEELRLDTFEFKRKQNIQVLIKGGIFRDLVMRKLIEVQIPMAGAIDIIEKELKVRDDFEYLLKKPYVEDTQIPSGGR